MREHISFRTKAILGTAAVVLVGIIIYLVIAWVHVSNERDEALRRSTGAATQNKTAAVDACQQVEQLGKTCVVNTEDLKSGKQVIQGLQGVQGIQGVPGVQGPRGLQGLQGVEGNTGKQGLPGLPGQPGPMGEPGPVGPMGPQGDRGDTGTGISQVLCDALVPGLRLTVIYDDDSRQEVICTTP